MNIHEVHRHIFPCWFDSTMHTISLHVRMTLFKEVVFDGLIIFEGLNYIKRQGSDVLVSVLATTSVRIYWHGSHMISFNTSMSKDTSTCIRFYGIRIWNFAEYTTSQGRLSRILIWITIFVGENSWITERLNLNFKRHPRVFRIYGNGLFSVCSWQMKE